MGIATSCGTGYGAVGQVCVPCLRGSFQPTPGNASCVPCPNAVHPSLSHVSDERSGRVWRGSYSSVREALWWSNAPDSIYLFYNGYLSVQIGLLVQIGCALQNTFVRAAPSRPRPATLPVCRAPTRYIPLSRILCGTSLSLGFYAVHPSLSDFMRCIPVSRILLSNSQHVVVSWGMRQTPNALRQRYLCAVLQRGTSLSAPMRYIPLSRICFSLTSRMSLPMCRAPTRFLPLSRILLCNIQNVVVLWGIRSPPST